MALDGSAEVSDSTILTPKPDSVRLAGPEDEERVYKFLTLLHAENGMSAVDRASAMEVIRKGTQKQGGLIGIIESEGKIIASIGLGLTKLWYSASHWYLEEMWMFVHPDHRTEHCFEQLVQFGKWAGESMKVPVSFAILTLGRLSAKTRLYRRYFPQIGSLFLHMPPEADGG